MQNKSKAWLGAAILLLIMGVLNLAESSFKKPTVFYNGERLKVTVKNEAVDGADFLRESRREAFLEEKSYPLKELCAQLGIAYSFNKKDNVYVLGDTAEYAREVPVLMYHHLLPSAEMWQRRQDNITLTVEEFTSQMDYLVSNGWQCISLNDLAAFVKGERLLAPKSILITFDDGFLSNYKYAYPILKERGMTAVLFVLSDYLTKEETDFIPSLMQYLSKEDLLLMQDVFSYGSHTANLHQIKGRKSVLCLQDAETVRRDFLRSKQVLSGTGYISYPYGAYNEQVVNIAKECGFVLGFGVGGDFVRMYDEPYTLKRFDMYRYRNLADFAELLESCK